MGETFCNLHETENFSWEHLKQYHLSSDESKTIEQIANMITTENEVKNFDEIHEKIISYLKTRINEQPKQET